MVDPTAVSIGLMLKNNEEANSPKRAKIEAVFLNIDGIMISARDLSLF